MSFDTLMMSINTEVYDPQNDIKADNENSVVSDMAAVTLQLLEKMLQLPCIWS